MKLINKVPKKYLYIILGVIMFVIAAAVMLWLCSGKETDKVGPEYAYSTYVEAKLADDVSQYLSGIDVISREAREEIANYSVQNYNAVINSGTSVVTDEHSETLTRLFQTKLEEYVSGQLTDEELYALSSGISSYVWKAVLLFMDNRQGSVDMTPDHDAEYMELARSLQEQIDVLEEKRMKIHITARFNDSGNEDGQDGADGKNGYKSEITKYVNGAFDSVNSSVDEKIENMDDGIDKKLDGMKDEIMSKVENELKNSMEDKNEIDKMKKDEIDKMKSEIASEVEKELMNSIKDGKDGIEGKAGKNGQDGADGKPGKDGQDGRDGHDGKSTYVAYADDESGAGFSLTPTETSKYIGTCITAADRQPSSASEYGNWQLYRNYIITAVTDENNNTTVYIK